MSMIKTVLLVLVAAVALLMLFAATRPDTFRVERSTTIAAPAGRAGATLPNAIAARWKA